MIMSLKRCTNKTNRMVLKQFTNPTIRDQVTFTNNYGWRFYKKDNNRY